MNMNMNTNINITCTLHHKDMWCSVDIGKKRQNILSTNTFSR